MNNFHTKNAPFSIRQLTRRGRAVGVPTGMLALLSLAACSSEGDDPTPATETPPTITESVTIADSTLEDALIYITPEGLLAGTNLAQVDLNSFELEGSDGAASINLGQLDSSEVSIVTNSEGNQVFAIARSAVNEYASNSNSTSSAPISYNLKATSAINFIDKQGIPQTIDLGDVITENALTIDRGLISVVKRLADFQGNPEQLATTTVDLSEVFTSVSAISFSAEDDEGNSLALSDKNGDGIAAEFSLDELAASFGESGTITVSAKAAGGIVVGQSFSVVVAQTAVNTPFVGDGAVVTITNGSANSASILALPLSGGDGEITYTLEGDNTESAELSILLQGEIRFSASASGTYTLIATDADGDRATVSIDYTIPDDEVSIANPLAAETHEGNNGNVTVSLAGVFDGGDGDLTLTSGDGTIANDILTIDTDALEDGEHTITVTAKDSDGDIAIDTFVLTVDKFPTLLAAIADATLAGSNDGTIIDVGGVFGHPTDADVLKLSASVGTIGTDGMLNLAGADLADGPNTITLTATDSDSTTPDSITSTFVLTTNKSPTVAATISDASVDDSFSSPGADTVINLMAVFGGGSGPISYGTSLGSISGGELTIAFSALNDGVNMITVNAIDADNEAVTDVFVLTKSSLAVSGLIDTTSLGAYGFIIQGDKGGDNLGYSVSAAGDVNGDGYADLIVGARQGDNGGGNAGEAYVIWGQADKDYGTLVSGRWVLDTTNLGNAGFIIQGDKAGDGLGWSVSAAGDVNGDGYADLIVGARDGDDGGSNAGEAYVIWGKSGTFGSVVDTTNLGDAGFIIQGDAEGDQFGISVAAAGDVNGDGYADLIVGADKGDDGDNGAGEAYLIWGRADTAYGTLIGGRRVVDTSTVGDAENPGFTGFIIQGDKAGDNLGYSVSAAGDVNGDGYADLIVGAYQSDSYTGEAYLIWGQASKSYGTLGSDGRRVVDTTNLGNAGFIIQGDAEGDQLGYSVSAAGDVDGDGYADLIVGAPAGDDGGTRAGEAYVIWGKSGTFGSVVDTTNLGNNGFIIQGDAASDFLGWSVSAAGDVNGDGYADLVVGARDGDDGDNDAGEAYVIWGQANKEYGTNNGGRRVVDTSNLGDAGFIIQGDEADDELGVSVAAAGDVNGDGYDDLIVGARYGDNGGDKAGEAYVIWGGAHLSGYRLGYDPDSANQPERAFDANVETSDYAFDFSDLFTNASGTLTLSYSDTESDSGSAATVGAARWNAATELLNIDLSAIDEDFDIIITATDGDGDSALWRIEVFDD